MNRRGLKNPGCHITAKQIHQNQSLFLTKVSINHKGLFVCILFRMCINVCSVFQTLSFCTFAFFDFFLMKGIFCSKSNLRLQLNVHYSDSTHDIGKLSTLIILKPWAPRCCVFLGLSSIIWNECKITMAPLPKQS